MNVSIYQAENFNERADTIDFLEFHIIDRIDGPGILKLRAEKAKRELEKVDAALFAQLRAQIRSGHCTGYAFLEIMRTYLGFSSDQPDKIGYDNLDLFINGLLSDQALPEATQAREPEMVFYQKTPARIMFELITLAEFNPDDVFFDLGSGLGQVTILINLVSGVIARGIEYEPAYCHYAKTCAAELNLSGVEFINADAREGDYSEGTVFFMYTPFEGGLLQDVLDLLQRESEKRTIRVFTYGPCSAAVARQSWLKCINGSGDNTYRLYAFRSGE